jgi:hypothetical protein
LECKGVDYCSKYSQVFVASHPACSLSRTRASRAASRPSSPRRSHRSRARASSMDVVFVSSRQRRRFRPTARRCPGWRCCLPNTRKVNWIQSRVLRAVTFKGKHSAFDKDKHTPSTLARTGPRRASLTHLSLLGRVVSRRDCCHLGHLGHAGSAGTRVLCLSECFLGWSAGSARGSCLPRAWCRQNVELVVARVGGGLGRGLCGHGGLCAAPLQGEGGRHIRRQVSTHTLGVGHSGGWARGRGADGARHHLGGLFPPAAAFSQPLLRLRV